MSNQEFSGNISIIIESNKITEYFDDEIVCDSETLVMIDEIIEQLPVFYSELNNGEYYADFKGHIKWEKYVTLYEIDWDCYTVLDEVKFEKINETNIF